MSSGSEQYSDVFGIAIESRMMQWGPTSSVLDVRVRARGKKVTKTVTPYVDGRAMYRRRVCVTCSVQFRLLRGVPARRDAGPRDQSGGVQGVVPIRPKAGSYLLLDFRRGIMSVLPASVVSRFGGDGHLLTAA